MVFLLVYRFTGSHFLHFVHQFISAEVFCSFLSFVTCIWFVFVFAHSFLQLLCLACLSQLFPFTNYSTKCFLVFSSIYFVCLESDLHVQLPFFVFTNKLDIHSTKSKGTSI